MDKENINSIPSEIEIVDELAELEEKYLNIHGGDVNNAFIEVMKNVFKNQRKQISSMSTEIRNLKREQSKMQCYQLEILKELKREQSITKIRPFENKHQNESLQKELLQKGFLLKEKEKQRRHLEQATKERNKRITFIEHELEERNKRLLIMDETCINMESTIEKLQNDMLIASSSAKEAQELLTKKQALVSRYQQALEKVADALGNNKDAIVSFLAQGCAIRAEVQDHRIESAIVSPSSANIVLQRKKTDTSMLIQSTNQSVVEYNKCIDQDLGNSDKSSRRCNRAIKRQTNINIHNPVPKSMRIECQKDTGENKQSGQEKTTQLSLEYPSGIITTRSIKKFKDNLENLDVNESKDTDFPTKLIVNSREQNADKFLQKEIHTNNLEANTNATCKTTAIVVVKNCGSKHNVFSKKYNIEVKHINNEIIEEIIDLPTISGHEMECN